jgi:hypothetical protein
MNRQRATTAHVGAGGKRFLQPKAGVVGVVGDAGQRVDLCDSIAAKLRKKLLRPVVAVDVDGMDEPATRIDERKVNRTRIDADGGEFREPPLRLAQTPADLGADMRKIPVVVAMQGPELVWKALNLR